MENRENDRRTRYTKKTIKDSFLQLLAKKPFGSITVTEVCRLSEINRGTFYLHYYDLDDVLDDVLTDALCGTCGILDHVLCPTGAGCSYPFCEKMRENEAYRPLFLDELAASRMLEKLTASYQEDYVKKLMEKSALTREQAEALFCFQINGCLAVNRRLLRDRSSGWRSVQGTVDHFLKVGLEGFFSR